MLLSKSTYVVKSKGKLLSSKKTYEIIDGESGTVLGTAKEVTGFLSSLLGATVVEVTDSTTNKPAFRVGRTGLLMKKDQVTTPSGEVIGRFKSKMLSLSGGFHIYDKDGKHIGEIQGKMMKAEYKLLTPDKKDMGKVSRTMGGLLKSLVMDRDTHAVQVAPEYSNDENAKTIMLAVSIAVESIFKKKKGGVVAGGGDSDEE